MARDSKTSLSRSAIAAYSCICTALALLLALTVWGSFRDMELHRATLLDAEIDALRLQAEQTVGRLERDLETRAATDLTSLVNQGWLQGHWEQVVPREERLLYAAVVDPEGEILQHSDAARQGGTLKPGWNKRALAQLGTDVVEATDSKLVLGQRAYDVRIPIALDGHEIGAYHTGFDADWFDRDFSDNLTSLVWRNSMVIGGVLLVVLLATTALYYIASHSLALRRAVDSAAIERATEVGKLAAGLAHEIRNPLHAIQLNLHAFRRIHEGDAELPPSETSAMLEQSTREIERIEQLMQQLVGFAAPEDPRDESLDLATVIRDVADFLQQELLERDIKLQLHLTAGSVPVQMDEGRLRQILLNLLKNAQQAMESGGRIDVRLIRRRGRVVIEVADDGPGIPPDDLPRVFDPFYSTKPEGTGLGLALVKRFVGELGGEIRCESTARKGTTFRIEFHESGRQNGTKRNQRNFAR